MHWINRYISSLKGRRTVIIDVEATDDNTYENQHLQIFKRNYGKFMLQKLFFLRC